MTMLTISQQENNTMFEIVNPKTKEKGRQHDGDYTDHLPALKRIAPVTIIQHIHRPDDGGTDTYRIHINQQARVRSRTARCCVIVLAVALLTVSCAKTAANGNSAISDMETGMCCEESLSDPSDPLTPPDTVIDLEKEWNEVAKLAHAFAVVESNDNPHAVNHRENAVGLLQIRPIMIRQANMIVGEDIYTLSDRHDSIMSIAIFHTVMSELNPTFDIDRAIEIWNPNASRDYSNLIKSVYYNN